MDSKVILYSTGCDKCLILKKKLVSKNIEFEECNDTDIMRKELFEKRGFKFMPILQVNDNFMEFPEATKWVNQQIKES